MFETIAASENTHLTTVKPLCPTRRTVHTSAIIAVLGLYEQVLSSPEEAKGTSNTAPAASGLFKHFSKSKTALGLTFASAVVGELKCLKMSLQGKTVSGMEAAGDSVQSFLQGKRNNKAYLPLYKRVVHHHHQIQ